MSFCIRNTSTSQAPTVNYLSFETSSISNPKSVGSEAKSVGSEAKPVGSEAKVIFEEKPPISSNESVLKFDMTTNSWVWREMNDTGIYCSKGPSGSLVNTQNSELVNISNNIENQSTVSDNIQSKKVEMSNNRKNKKRQQKKK